MPKAFEKIKEEIKKKILRTNEILKMEEKEQPFLLDKMIVEGSINALTSDSGKGKSLVMLKMAEAIVRGEDFLGKYPTKKTKTLIIDLEMSENDIIQRVKSVVQTEIEGLDFYSCQTFNIENKDDFAWLCDIIKEREYGLIVFDTLSAIHDRDENSNSLMNQVNKRMLEITNSLKATVLFLHHHRKPVKGEPITQSSSRGAGSIIDKAASQLLLDSNETTIIKHKSEFKGMRVSLQQFKKRQVERLTGFALNTFYDPFEQKTFFEWVGELDEGQNAVEIAKNLIIKALRRGEEYTVSCFSGIEGIPSERNIRKALDELTTENIIFYRFPVKGIDEFIHDKKVRHNTKIYGIKGDQNEGPKNEENGGFLRL